MAMPKITPIQEEHREAMNRLAIALDIYLNGDAQGNTQKDERQYGFALLVFDFGNADRARMNWISNGKRVDMLVALKEMVARFEGRMTDNVGRG